jgi:hypothetical protein
MIKHIVMIKLQDEAEGETKAVNALKIKELLYTLPQIIEEIVDYEVGINIGESPRAYDICLISSFKSFDDLHKYLKHEAHLKVVEFVDKRRMDTKTVDFEVQSI